MDTDSNDIAAGISNCIARDGQAAPTANIPFAGYKITGLGAGAAATDAVNFGQVFVAPSFTGGINVAGGIVGTGNVALSGGTFTLSGGAVSMSGATSVTAPTPAAGDNSTNVATTAFSAALAFAAALPVQTGNAGKSISTDGATASWSSLLNASVLRWKDGTDATKLVAYDLSGITTGTTRTFTAPNKSGTMAMISDVGLLSLPAITPTAAANIDALSVFSASYDNYRIFLEGILPSATDGLSLRLATGGAADAGSNYVVLDTAGGAAVTTTATTMLMNGSVLNTGKGLNGVIDILNANDGTNNKLVIFTTGAQNAATPSWVGSNKTFQYINAAAVTGFRLYWTAAANFAASGHIRIYGYN